MTAVGNILLRIGSEMGPGGFASLQSAIQMIGQLAGSVKEAVAFLDDYAEKMSLVDMELINYADKMSKAQVGSLGLMSAMGRLNIAGVKVTKEQFAAMSVAADDYADRVGGTASEAMDTLTAAMIRGNERGLKPFGIEIDANNKAMDGTAQALDQIGKKFGGVEGDISNTSDAMKSMKNNTIDLFGAIWDGLNKNMAPMTDFMTSISEWIGDMAAAMPAWSDAVDIAFDDFFTNLSEADQKAKNSKILSILTGGRFAIYEEDIKGGNKRKDILEGEQFSESNEWDEPKSWASETPGTGVMIESTDKTKRSGGSGSKKNMTAEELWAMQYDATQAAIEAAIKGGPRPEKTYVSTAQDTRGMDELLGGTPGSMSFESADAEQANAEAVGKYTEALKGANATIEERISAQKELDDMIAQGAENLESQMTIEEMNHQAIMGYREEEMLSVEAQIALEDQLANSFESRSARVSEGVQRIVDAWRDVKGMIRMVSDAYENGTENMSTADAVFFYIDNILGAANEAAKAVAALAREDYLEAALHTAAVAAYTSAAALAASHGGGGTSGQTSTVSSIGPASTAGQYSGGYDRGREVDTLNIHLSMDDDTKAMGWIIDQNYRRARSGEPHFQEAA